MLRPRQIVICGSLAVAFWAVAALCIRLDPAAVGHPRRRAHRVVVSKPGWWVCGIYALDDRIGRLGAAWLLWGYGLTAWITLFVAAHRARGSGRGQGMALRPAPAG